jgi:hypothetical protein
VIRVHVACLGLALAGVTLLAPVPRVLGAAQCMDRFPEGRYGIPLHSAIASVKPTLKGFSPLYVQKLPVAIATPADCEYVYTGDVFRLVESPTALFAGCIGDFDGNGQPDVALLMKRRRDGRVLPVIFRSQGARYDVTVIDHITDPYGFNENASVWPGPFCHPKPPNGVFESDVGGQVTVVGDLFTIGWFTYFWSTAASRFDAILTSD